MDAIREEQREGYTIKIYQDEYCDNPRTVFDHLGTMALFHRRYALGDKDHRFDYDGGAQDAMDYFSQDPKDVIYLPVYMYDHSGITISTRPFSCPWDSGQVGWVFVTIDKVKEEYHVMRVSKRLRDQITSQLEAEVREYDHFLTGDVYGYVIESPDGEVIESVWGYYGDDEIESCMLPQCRGLVDHHAEKRAEHAEHVAPVLF